jgi:hypothetical protein
MYLKTKIEKLENKVGIGRKEKPILVVMMKGETHEAALHRNNISPKIKSSDERLIFIVTNIRRSPNDPPLKENEP